METKLIISQKLKQLRGSFDYTQKFVDEKLGVTYQVYHPMS